MDLLQPLPEHSPLRLNDHHHHQHVGFDELVELIVPPAELPKGRPRVQLRKMSLPVSFQSKPAECDLDDPSFIPNRPRRLSLRLPSFSRTPTIPLGSPTAVDGPGGGGLRSCLISGASSTRPAGVAGPSTATSSSQGIAIPGSSNRGLLGRSRSHELSPVGAGACSFSALLSASPPAQSASSSSSSAAHLSSSVPSSSTLPVLHVPPVRRRSSTVSNSGRPPSLPPSPGSPGSSPGMASSLLLPLRNCCHACERSTELALLGKCVEQFSPGARKKHADDLKERAADEAMQARWKKGAIRVDEVAKKREGRETGLRETDPPAEEDEDAFGAAVGEEANPVDQTLQSGSATTTADEPSVYTTETRLSTPATDETLSSTATTTTTEASSLSQTPPLSPSAGLTPSQAHDSRSPPTSPAASSPAVVVKAGGGGAFVPSGQRPPPRSPPLQQPSAGQHPAKRKLWGMTLGPLPAFANPFGAGHRSDADSGVAGIAGGHGRFS